MPLTIAPAPPPRTAKAGDGSSVAKTHQGLEAGDESPANVDAHVDLAHTIPNIHAPKKVQQPRPIQRTRGMVHAASQPAKAGAMMDEALFMGQTFKLRPKKLRRASTWLRCKENNNNT